MTDAADNARPTTAPSIKPITTYLDKWEGLEEGSVLGLKEFQGLFSKNASADAMWKIYEQTNQDKYPMGLLALVAIEPDDYFVVPIHSPERAKTKPGSTLADALIGVECDRGTTLVMRKLSSAHTVFDMFSTVIVPNVPKDAEFLAYGKNRDNQLDGLLAPFTATGATTEEVTVHRCCPVNSQVLQEVVGQIWRPFELYQHLHQWYTHLDSEQQLARMAVWEPTQWARAASLWIADANDANAPLCAPPLAIANFETWCPQLRESLPDHKAYIQDRMDRDFPDRKPTPGDTSFAYALEELRKANLLKDGSSTPTVVTAPGPTTDKKTWKSHSGLAYEILCRLQGTADESQFANGFKQLIDYPKKEWRMQMELALNSASNGLVGRTPVIHKALVENITTGQWACKPTEQRHYELAVSLFSMVPPTSPLGKAMIQQTAIHDETESGRARLTNMQDIKSSTKVEVMLLDDLDKLDTALHMMATFLDLYEHAEHAECFRNFLTQTWPNVRLSYRTPDTIPRDTKYPALTLSCYIAEMMNEYWHHRQCGGKPNLPAYDTVLEVLSSRKWHLIQHTVPTRYLDIMEAAKRSTRTPTPDQTPSSGSESGGASPSRETPQVMVTNPELVEAWNTAWLADGRTITTLQAQGNIPHVKVQGSDKPICISWNLKGACSSKCKKSYSHYTSVAQEHIPKRVMSAATRGKIQNYVDTHLGTDNAGQNS